MPIPTKTTRTVDVAILQKLFCILALNAEEHVFASMTNEAFYDLWLLRTITVENRPLHSLTP
jgi:hypothetical protein